MEKTNKPKIVTFAILTAITSLVWLFFSVYMNLKKSVEPAIPAHLLMPFEPNLDNKVLSEIKTKEALIITDEIETQQNEEEL